MKTTVRIILTTVIALFISTSAFAWPDGDKQGLVLGLTGGAGQAGFETESSSETGVAYMAGALIGYGFNDRFLLNFKYRYWYADVDDVVFHTWSWCADAMLFPVKNNGFFLNAGVGRALTLPDVSDAESQGGVFVYGGIGYEVTKWVFLTVDYGVGSYTNNIDGTTLTFSVSFVGY